MADAMKLVTDEMVEAGAEALFECYGGYDDATRAHMKMMAHTSNLLRARKCITAALAASPPAREEAPGEGAGEDALAEFLAGKFRANIYDHPHKSVTKSDEHTINLFADVAAEALRARTSEPAREAAEPCYECGSTERMGTACKPCNPEITDPNFGYTHPAPATADKLKVAVELLNDCIWFDPVTLDYRVEHDGSVEKARAIIAALNEEGC